jgi:hypothetical protein
MVVAASAFWLTHRSLGYWSADDAGITYAYSISLADHGSLSPLPESMPVEGYSNPLLFWLVALLRLVHLFDPITTHTKIEMIAFALMILPVYELLRARFETDTALVGTGLFVALELLTPATWLWYSSGLENVFVSLALITLLWLADRAQRLGTFQPVLVGPLCFLVALVRPEAPAYVATFYVALLVLARRADHPWLRHVVRLVIAITITAALYIGYVCLRHATYGTWLPNTYFAKLVTGPNLVKNLTDYVFPVVFPYAFSLLFALAVGVMWLLEPHRKFALLLGGFIAVSLVMSLIGGNDWMGEHRFATPFFAMGHVAACVLIAALHALRKATFDPLARRIVLAIALVPVVALTAERIVGPATVFTDVTIARVFELHGVRRMQHQRRLGVINPVVVAPDAGGTLLFRSLQHIDNGFLTDFQMGHMTKELPVITQYEVIERAADLADTNTSWPFDRALVPTQYVAHVDYHMFARHDLVEVDAAPPVVPFHDRNGVRLYMSPENVLAAGPHGLVRIEVIEAWDNAKAAQELNLRAAISDDDDSISLAPYGDINRTPKPTGIQRQALLLRAPSTPGTYDVTFELAALKESLWRDRVLIQIHVVAQGSMQPAVDEIVGTSGAAPDLVMQRFAWLREQSIPRMSHRDVRRMQRSLVNADKKRAKQTARYLRTLTWDARLAALTSEVPASIRASEQGVVERMLGASCTAAVGRTHRALCLGRAIDRLRRYGYFGVLARVPAVAAELERIAADLGQLAPDGQYIALVGLSLAMPERIDLQKALLAARERYLKRGTWPSLDL